MSITMIFTIENELGKYQCMNFISKVLTPSLYVNEKIVYHKNYGFALYELSWEKPQLHQVHKTATNIIAKLLPQKHSMNYSRLFRSRYHVKMHNHIGSMSDLIG